MVLHLLSSPHCLRVVLWDRVTMRSQPVAAPSPLAQTRGMEPIKCPCWTLLPLFPIRKQSTAELLSSNGAFRY